MTSAAQRKAAGGEPLSAPVPLATVDDVQSRTDQQFASAERARVAVLCADASAMSLLRPELAARPEPVLSGLRVASETGHGVEGGPPSLPWLRLTEDGHTWSQPAVQRVVIQLTCWHRTERDAKAAVGLALAVLCNGLTSADPITGPIAAPDPHTTQPLATATVAVRVRTPARP